MHSLHLRFQQRGKGTLCIFWHSANGQWLFMNWVMYAHPCLWAVCWHCWWWTGKVKIYHLHPLLRLDNISLNWHPPALKTLQNKRKVKSTQNDLHVQVCNSSCYGNLSQQTLSIYRLSCTRGADVGWNRYIRAETQEVAFVGLLILRTVWDRPYTAHWEQRLMGNRTEI